MGWPPFVEHDAVDLVGQSICESWRADLIGLDQLYVELDRCAQSSIGGLENKRLAVDDFRQPGRAQLVG